VRLCLVASKPTESVIFGFLPAAARLGLDVLLLTDKPREHEQAIARSRRLPRPGAPGDPLPGPAPVRMLGCDVRDFRALIAAIAAGPPADAIVTNSDHLQAQAALAAAYFGRPGKDWRAALRAKNKPLMRRRLAETGTEQVAALEIPGGTLLAGADPAALGALAYPVVLKPAEGVASEDVTLVASAAELARQCARVGARRPGEALVAEEYLPGGLRTMETLSDGRTTWILGGFATRLSPPPLFIEERLTWTGPPPQADRAHVLAALDALGGSFGPCHTEYVAGDRGPALIEVNDRLIGDTCDFVLGDLLGTDLFEAVLRVYLGEPLPLVPPGPAGLVITAPVPGQPGAPAGEREAAGSPAAHAIVDYVVAGRAGVLTGVPPAGPLGDRLGDAADGVAVSCWPWRADGDRIEVTGTNRDYLAVITAIGPDEGAAERAVAAARAGGAWAITEPGA
jgi:hypothetical protein